MTGSQNSNIHGEQNMELWRKFSWGKEQQLKHIPIKTSSPLLCWILNHCTFFIQSEHQKPLLLVLLLLLLVLVLLLKKFVK